LIERCSPDCILEFRRASAIRHQDACLLAKKDRRTAAIYLWGYAAEMTLKAAYFTLAGFSETQPIRPKDLSLAMGPSARSCGFSWPPEGRGHNLTCWAELLVRFRGLLGKGYADARFGDAVVDHGTRIYLRWRETLRYHKNQAYAHEVEKVRDSTTWLLDRSGQL
jgi:hypothetical protein